jgi:hypothetical protein
VRPPESCGPIAVCPPESHGHVAVRPQGSRGPVAVCPPGSRRPVAVPPSGSCRPVAHLPPWTTAGEQIQIQWRREWRGCRMDLPGPTTLVGTKTNYSVGPWDYPACATRHLMACSTRTMEENYSVRKLYMSCAVWKTPRRTRLVLSPYSDL